MRRFTFGILLWAYVGWRVVDATMPLIDRHVDEDAYANCVQQKMAINVYANGYLIQTCEVYR